MSAGGGVTSVRWTSVAVLGALALACAGRPVGPSAAPVSACEAGDSTMVRDMLYFGRNRPSGGLVSDAEWQSFLDEVVTPRFPAGLTVIDAKGQWRGESGRVEQEKAEILTLFHPGDAAARRAVDQVIHEYQRRFQQEAVLRERTHTCTHF
jgi:Protein of unknown function (DUF3574)